MSVILKILKIYYCLLCPCSGVRHMGHGTCVEVRGAVTSSATFIWFLEIGFRWPGLHSLYTLSHLSHLNLFHFSYCHQFKGRRNSIVLRFEVLWIYLTWLSEWYGQKFICPQRRALMRNVNDQRMPHCLGLRLSLMD